MDKNDKDMLHDPNTEEHGGNKEAPQTAPDLPITAPTPPEADWYAKIQRAKEAREAGIKMRKGKPATVITQSTPV